MNTYIALLRGINVSGQKKILMADLKALFETLDFEDVQTYIQSGNVVFKSVENDISKLVSLIEDAINTRYGFDVAVQVISKQEINDVVENLPFKGERAFNRLAVVFLAAKPDNIPLADIEPLKAKDDEIVFKDRFIYLYIPQGFGKSKLDNNTIERKIKVRATTRNWNTILKLQEMV